MIASHSIDPLQLVADDLSVWRGERCLLDGVRFALGAGEALWLRGDNGVGKTSLLRVLAGLALAERGSVRWCDRDARHHAPEYCADLLYLGHLDALKRALTARENLLADAALRAGADDAAVASALAALGVAHCADLPVAQLSAGQRRRVALARLPLSRARVWLLDEPTTHLDQEGQTLVAALIDRHLAGGGLAVIASHLPLAMTRALRTLALEPRPALAA